MIQNKMFEEEVMGYIWVLSQPINSTIRKETASCFLTKPQNIGIIRNRQMNMIHEGFYDESP